MKHKQVVIIGGGSAGLSAAVTLKEHGIEDICILEKDGEAGGILEQCIHNGFGLQTFHEQLSGPAYAERYIRKAEQLQVDIRLNTMVTRITKDKQITYVNGEEGEVTIEADAIILCVGCYERARGAVEIAGSRPAGIYTAGQAQRYINIEGFMPGKRVWILGSGDIGLIMARRMVLEGAEVLGVAEIMPYSSGLPRNLQQCLYDFHIPLYLSHTVTKVFGKKRLEKIEVMEVDENRMPIAGSEKYYDVDTLLLSTGLIPENSLGEQAGISLDPSIKGPYVDESYMTEAEGIFAAGNGLHVHDLVDYVSLQAKRAAEGVVEYLYNGKKEENTIRVCAGDNVSYVVPQSVHPSCGKNVEFFFRIRKPVTKALLQVRCGDKVLRSVHKTNMMPSEMERMIITAKELQKMDGDLAFSVMEEEA